MADSDPFADLGGEIVCEMYNRAVLNVGVRSHADGVEICAQNRLKPYAGFFSEVDVADEGGVWSDERRGMKLSLSVEERLELEGGDHV